MEEGGIRGDFGNLDTYLIRGLVLYGEITNVRGKGGCGTSENRKMVDIDFESSLRLRNVVRFSQFLYGVLFFISFVFEVYVLSACIFCCCYRNW